MPGPDQPEQSAVTTPEQAGTLRGVEVKPTPIPEFDGENASGVHDAFATNLNLVSGGTVTTADGKEIKTEGILGSAQDRIAARLEEINATGQALTGEREQFGGQLKGLKEPKAVRAAEQEKRQISQADNKASAVARNSVTEQQRRIRQLCERQHMSKESQVKYDHTIAIEEYLNANPDTTDLQPIQQNINALKWTRREPTRERIENILDGATTAVQGYDEYKTLTIGQGEGDKRTKGLRDFKADLEAAEEHRKSNTANLQSKLDAVKARAKEWEDRNARFKHEDTPEQRRLKQDHALGQAVAEFLGKSYVPDAEELIQVGEGLSVAKDQLRQGSIALQSVAKLPIGGRIAKWLLDIAAPRILQELNQKVAGLNYEQHQLVDPATRLTQPGAPKALVDMVRKVNARDFDMAKIPAREKVLAETVTALLGKGTVNVEDSSQEETTTIDAVPGIAGPADGGAGPEQPPPPTPDELANLAMTGQLTVDQLLNLPEDAEIRVIDDDLTDPKSFNYMNADLQTSLKAAEDQPGTGISKDHLPLIIIDALKRIAPYMQGIYAPDQPVTVIGLQVTLDRVSNEMSASTTTDPAKLAELATAKRLLALAQTAHRLWKP